MKGFEDVAGPRVEIWGDFKDGRPDGGVMVSYDRPPMDRPIGLAKYQIVDGQLIDFDKAQAKEAGQTFIKLENDKGFFDVRAYRRSPDILGLVLGQSWETTRHNRNFKQDKTVFDHPCEFPVRQISGNASGQYVIISLLNGKVSQISIKIDGMNNNIRDFRKDVTVRFGAPDNIFQFSVLDAYAYYGAQAADIAQTRVAEVTVIRTSESHQFFVQFNDMASQPKFASLVNECMSRAGASILGAGIEAAGKALAGTSQIAGKAGKFKCKTYCSGEFGFAKSDYLAPITIEGRDRAGAEAEAKKVFDEQCKAYPFYKDSGQASPDYIDCARQ